MTRIALAAALVAAPVLADTPSGPNRIDIVRPDAPERGTFGAAPIGVRTMTFVDEGRIDVAATTEETLATEDRRISAEIWYPAAEGTEPGGTYETVIRDGVTPTVLTGRAARDAAPAEGPFPLVVISHGYPGNRFLLSHLGERLASRGYVVASLDHPESTYDDQGPFPSTLVNRPVDQAFAIRALTSMEGDLGDAVDAASVGVVGYSMGGYGALILGGAGLSEAARTRTEPVFFTAPQGLLERHTPGSKSLRALRGPNLKAVVAIGPWGRNNDFWDAGGLAGFAPPLLLIAGSEDAISGYGAMRAIFEETVATQRLMLTYEGAGHNAAAPMPAPAEAWAPSPHIEFPPFEHYADAIWDTRRMNDILAHFTASFMDLHLKGDASALPLLAPPAEGETLAGFGEGRDAGLRLERLGGLD